MPSRELEAAIERATGMDIETLRNTTIDDRRAQIEQERGKATKFRSYFPLIGRRHIRAKSHEEVEMLFRKALEGR